MSLLLYYAKRVSQIFEYRLAQKYLKVGDVIEPQIVIGHHGRLRLVPLPGDGDGPPQGLDNLLVVGLVLRETHGRVDRRLAVESRPREPPDLGGQATLEVLEQLAAAGAGRVSPALGFLLQIFARVLRQAEPVGGHSKSFIVVGSFKIHGLVY